VKNLDKEKTLKQLKLDIEFAKRKIDELDKQEKNVDKIFYQGMLQAYESLQARIINGYCD
jgi:chaperonin cofactor prefoldin